MTQPTIPDDGYPSPAAPVQPPPPPMPPPPMPPPPMQPPLPARRSWVRRAAVPALTGVVGLIVGASAGHGGASASPSPAAAAAAAAAVRPSVSVSVSTVTDYLTIDAAPPAATVPAAAAPPVTTTPVAPPLVTTTLAAAAPGFGPGTYEVGTGEWKMPAGKYRTTGPSDSNCYWAREKNTSGEFSALIANGNTQGTATVTIAKSDGAFETNGCNNWVKIG